MKDVFDPHPPETRPPTYATLKETSRKSFEKKSSDGARLQTPDISSHALLEKKEHTSLKFERRRKACAVLTL